MRRKLMYNCWRLGLKTPKIIEYFAERGYAMENRDVLHLFKSVVEEKLKGVDL